jgi:hypothetical protein
MKKLAIILASATLAGCATQQPYYAAGTYIPPADPGQWRVVSVTPVAPGTGARAAAAGDTGVVTSSGIEYSPQQAPQTVFVPQPVYVPAPVYAPAPVYVQEPYWYPPISIGLGFSFGRGWGGHRGGWGRGHAGGGFRHR